MIKYMEKKEVRFMLDLLFKDFNVKPVPITIRNVESTYGGHKIQIGLKARSTLKKLEDIILHEFTHSLDWRKNGDKYRRKNGKGSYHDTTFTRLLEQVTNAWYGNSEKYQWSGEYPTVRKAHKDI
tara:strand:+ start:125 stop:499 length:375 start_codon:yes stop_codon:yes gene_type:complete